MNFLNSEVKIEKFTVGQMATNCYIVHDDDKNALIIDPGANADLILTHIEKRKLNVRYIINTHGHYDHIGANYIKNMLNSRPLLGIHLSDETFLKNPELNLSILSGNDFVADSPDFFLEENQLIKVTEKFLLSVIHTPGHTPGSVCLKLGNCLFSGDLLFCGGVGRTDLPGGNEYLLFKSLHRILQLDRNMIVLPGHGPKTTIGTEIETNPFLVST
ncbi:MAG TPA: MBL fold metallo-hydrolase [bacterium]|mgnify:CR=1 FL=1|nr:MBL fold metallo-hydrolase [bacterium]HOL34348.1 MBL fold metallo-hydrolase [bacterium]HPP07990.1 MBL fold metallo-hydrolase [bacterium]